jgi:hypothetical protein
VHGKLRRTRSRFPQELQLCSQAVHSGFEVVGGWLVDEGQRKRVVDFVELGSVRKNEVSLVVVFGGARC